ncbi:MAG: hypothetical protein R3F34_06070 [Planctomycetota bacterium]
MTRRASSATRSAKGDARWTRRWTQGAGTRRAPPLVRLSERLATTDVGATTRSESGLVSDLAERCARAGADDLTTNFTGFVLAWSEHALPPRHGDLAEARRRHGDALIAAGAVDAGLALRDRALADLVLR